MGQKLKVLRPSSTSVRECDVIAFAIYPTKRQSGLSRSHLRKNLAHLLKANTYTVGQLQSRYKNEERTSLSPRIAHRSIFLSTVSAVRHTGAADGEDKTAPKDMSTSAKHEKITAPYSRWVNANDYTSYSRTRPFYNP